MERTEGPKKKGQPATNPDLVVENQAGRRPTTDRVLAALGLPDSGTLIKDARQVLAAFGLPPDQNGYPVALSSTEQARGVIRNPDLSQAFTQVRAEETAAAVRGGPHLVVSALEKNKTDATHISNVIADNTEEQRRFIT